MASTTYVYICAHISIHKQINEITHTYIINITQCEIYRAQTNQLQASTEVLRTPKNEGELLPIPGLTRPLEVTIDERQET